MKDHMHNALDDLIILNKLGIKGRCITSPKIIEVTWMPPLHHWLKVNTDGMALGSPGLAAIGGVFRTYRGFSKGCFCKAIGIHNAFFAELLAFITAVDIAWNKGWFNIWFEMDSLSVVNCIYDQKFSPPWPLITAWSTCKSKFSQMNFHVSHKNIFREGNQVADCLSKLGLSHSDLKWWSSHPHQVDRFLAHDYASLPHYRFK